MIAPYVQILHVSRAKIVEARIDQTLGVVRKLNASDIGWLRQHEPQTLAEKAKQLGEELSLLASAVEPETISIEEMEREAAA
jgi:Holliday junction resolvasome RuvABC endonuclease subunit